MTDASPTTRDSDLYDDIIQSRVVNQADGDSRVEDIVGRVEWSVTVKATMNMMLFFPFRTESSTVSRDTYNGVQELRALPSSELSDIAKYGRLKGRTATIRNGRWNGRIVDEQLRVTAFVQLRLPDGSRTWLRLQEHVGTYENVIAALCRAAAREEPVSATTTENGYRVTARGRTAEGRGVDNSGVRSTTAFDRLRAYFEAGSPVVEGVVEHSDDGNSVFVDVQLRDTTVRFGFDDPSSEESVYWDVVRGIGVADDPLSMRGETVYLTHETVTGVDADAALAVQDGWLLFADDPRGVASRLRRAIGP